MEALHGPCRVSMNHGGSAWSRDAAWTMEAPHSSGSRQGPRLWLQLQLQALSIMQVWVHLFWTVHTAVHVEAGLAVQHSEFLSTSAITRSNINNALVPLTSWTLAFLPNHAT